ncbi:phosphotransferase [Nocardioides sp.]|uniref:phosphotransferase n=1 Tax=Nocardioides sp. TaxID=35761 RepID=UPI001A25700F|nr:phosphotransferase [Nocardioides sp.]MBJ7356567.1 phosphotransferase [Nocardioides sp.]
MSIAATGRRVAVEVGRAGVDRVRRRAGLPRCAADLGPADLARVLGRPVTGVSPLDGTTGTTDRARLAVEGPGLPPTVFVKTAAVDAGTRLFGGLARLGEVEVGFYRDVRPGLDLRAPRLLGATFDRGTGRFVIVLEDLAAEGAVFCDTLSRLSVDQTAAVLSTLARLHGATHANLPRVPWLGTNSGDALLPLISGTLPRLAAKVAERAPEMVPSDAAPLLRGYRRWASTLDEGPHSVLHGDPHPGNVYLLGEDGAGLLDWQAVRRGNPLRDVTYHLVLGMAVPDRRAHERDLLAHYAGELAAHGGPDLDADECWRRHRRMAAYAYVAAVFTSGLGGLQNAEIADAGLKRAGVAVADLETVALVG